MTAARSGAGGPSGSAIRSSTTVRAYSPEASSVSRSKPSAVTAAITVCMQALYDAADDDSATGGPDLTRNIYPVVAVITADGFRRLTDEEAATYSQAVVEERLSSPGGPIAPLRQSQQNG